MATMLQRLPTTTTALQQPANSNHSSSRQHWETALALRSWISEAATGLHAREAIDLGALRVGLVDISAEMLKVAQIQERSPAHFGKIKYFETDVSKTLGHMRLREVGYDVVMANWIFGYAPTMEVLECMFANIAKHLKPGGKFVGVRDADVEGSQAVFSKYGVSAQSFEHIPGGIKYLVVIHSTPPTTFEATSLDVIRSGSTAMYEKYELKDVRGVPCEDAAIV